MGKFLSFRRHSYGVFGRFGLGGNGNIKKNSKGMPHTSSRIYLFVSSSSTSFLVFSSFSFSFPTRYFQAEELPKVKGG